MIARACKTAIDHSSAGADAEVVAGIRVLLTAIAVSCRFDAMLRVASLAWIDVIWYAVVHIEIPL